MCKSSFYPLWKLLAFCIVLTYANVNYIVHTYAVLTYWVSVYKIWSSLNTQWDINELTWWTWLVNEAGRALGLGNQSSKKYLFQFDGLSKLGHDPMALVLCLKQFSDISCFNLSSHTHTHVYTLLYFQKFLNYRCNKCYICKKQIVFY